MAAGLWVSPLVGGYKSGFDDTAAFVRTEEESWSGGSVFNFLAAATVLCSLSLSYFLAYFMVGYVTGRPCSVGHV